MPLFDYECRRCGNQFEELIRGSDDADDVSCPACGETKAERQVSAGLAIGRALAIGGGGGGGGCGRGGFT